MNEELIASDIRSAIRSALVVAGTLGVSYFAGGANVDNWANIAAAVIIPLLAVLWSRRDRKKLLMTDPGKIAPILLAGALLPLAFGCAATVGSTAKTSPGQYQYANGSPNTTTINVPGVEDLSTNGVGSSGYISSNADENRWLYNGATPVSTSARRMTDGTLVFNMGSGKDTVIRAGQVNFDPATGTLVGKNLEISSNASEPTRASNEALDRLTKYWETRDQAARDVLIKQIETTGQIPKDLAPFVVQLLLGL